jgi:hypothetical protein
MKTVKFLAIAIAAMLMVTNSFAQTTKTETIKVSGNCGMCKSRIEAAAKMDGVSKADWNKETKMLTLAYDPSKVKSDDVQKKSPPSVTTPKSTRQKPRPTTDFPDAASTGNLRMC